jgi:hypothetical protein
MVVREARMWNEAVQRDRESVNTNRDRFGFVDAKGVEWKVVWRDLPERRGRVVLEFASATGKRRSAEIRAVELEELRNFGDMAWRRLLANAAVIELE